MTAVSEENLRCVSGVGETDLATVLFKIAGGTVHENQVLSGTKTNRYRVCGGGSVQVPVVGMPLDYEKPEKEVLCSVVEPKTTKTSVTVVVRLVRVLGANLRGVLEMGL